MSANNSVFHSAPRNERPAELLHVVKNIKYHGVMKEGRRPSYSSAKEAENHIERRGKYED